MVSGNGVEELSERWRDRLWESHRRVPCPPSGQLAGGGCVVIGQIVSALVVAVLLMAVSVGWAMRGALEVDERLRPSPHRRKRTVTVRPEAVRVLSEGRLILVTAFLLGFALYFLARSMGRGLPVLSAVVLAFTYAVLCAMATGFTVWVQTQRGLERGDTTQSGPFRWATWVGVGAGILAVSFLIVDVFTNLTS